jgi:hypothetical protein
VRSRALARIGDPARTRGRFRAEHIWQRRRPTMINLWYKPAQIYSLDVEFCDVRFRESWEGN